MLYQFQVYSKVIQFCIFFLIFCSIIGYLKLLTTWPASWEICMQVRKQQLELDMEHQTGSK